MACGKLVKQTKIEKKDRATDKKNHVFKPVLML